MNLNKTPLQTAIYNNLHWQQPTPYQQQQMPFAVGAVFSASLFAGAALSTASVLATIAVVATVAGAALTVVGLVTGNESLTKIGAMIGLAGGVASLGVSAASVGTSVAGQAAKKAGETAAVEGTKAAVKTAAPAVIKSGVQTTGTKALVDVGTKAVSTSVAGAGALKTGTASAPVKPVFTPSPITGSASSGTLNVSGGPQSAPVIQADAAQTSFETMKATDAADAQGSWFDFLGKPQTVGSSLAGEALKGGAAAYSSYQSNQATQANNAISNQLERDKFNRTSTIQDRESAVLDRKYANANVQGRIDFSARELTPEERAAEELLQAQRAKRSADILSGAPV